MELSILIVNWNTKNLIVRCLESVISSGLPSGSYEIIVVDNASSDGSRDAIFKFAEGRKEIRLIEAGENLGFAKANNLAYRSTKGEYIFLLNPDTEVRQGSLNSLVEYLKNHADAGAVGPRLVNPDGSPQPSVRRFPGLLSSLLVFSGLHRLFRPRNYLMDDFNYEIEAEVDQVMGAAIMTRRELIEKIGLFDERFHLWYEEVDFCLRIKKGGYKVMYFPGSTVMHHTAQSFSQLAVLRRKKTVARSLVYYFEKNRPVWQTFILKLFLPAILLAATAIDVFQQLSGRKSAPKVS